MPNVPTITSVEIAAVGAAVFLLYVAPFLLATIEHHLRQRAQRLSAAFSLTESLPSTAAAQSGMEEPTAPEAPPADTHPEATAAAPGEPTGEPWRSAPETTGPISGETLGLPASRDGSTEPVAARRFDGNAGHRFRLEDLHRARLEGWPPATIRDDAAQRQVWSEAQQVAETHPAVFSSILVSPCQVRSVCLGVAEKDGARFRLCFFLFPGLWPVSPDQAVSQAVFDVDSVTGEVRHWLELLR